MPFTGNMMITIILPTYNEKDSLPVLIRKINGMGLKHTRLLVIDDNSPDGTGKVADGLAKKYKNVNVIHRFNERGLGSAIKFGFEKAGSEIIGVMDTDVSHDPSALPAIFSEMKKGADFVIGSRYAPGGSIRNWPFTRKTVSRIATLMVKPLTNIKDPMSGFFFVKRHVINFDVNPESCKICLDIIVRGKYKKILEVPYAFTNRKRGKTKILTLREIIKYIKYIIYLYKYSLTRR